MTAPGPGHDVVQPHRHAGISVALRVDAGMAVLLVGADDGALGEAMAATGAQVTILEADPTLARTAAARLLHQPSAQVVGATLTDWIAEADSRLGRVDLVVFLEPPPGTPIATATLEEVLATDVLFEHSGVVALGIHNSWGLSRLLQGTAKTASRSPLALAGRLNEYGLDQQRWLIPYPDHHRPQAIVDVSLFEEANGPSLISSIVRDPVAAPEGQPLLGPPRRAFKVALDARLAPAMADSVIVLASHSSQALTDVSRQGVLWTVPPPDLAPTWQCPRELVKMGGRHLWHPITPYRTVASGPLLLEPATVPAMAGNNGEDIVVDALTGPGAFSEASRQVLAAWWQAAADSLVASEPGRRPLDVRPRHFTVDDDGTWHYQAQDLAMRFAVPTEILALGAMVDTILDAVLAQGWLVGLGPGTTISGAARALLSDIGVACDDAMEFLWLETTADIFVRSREGLAREDARQLLQRRADARLDSGMASMPVSELLAAGTRLPEVSARLATLQAELAQSQDSQGASGTGDRGR